ncbi:hypothetical protein D3C87_1520990 [compost metagenome]
MIHQRFDVDCEHRVALFQCEILEGRPIVFSVVGRADQLPCRAVQQGVELRRAIRLLHYSIGRDQGRRGEAGDVERLGIHFHAGG